MEKWKPVAIFWCCPITRHAEKTKQMWLSHQEKEHFVLPWETLRSLGTEEVESFPRTGTSAATDGTGCFSKQLMQIQTYQKWENYSWYQYQVSIWWASIPTEEKSFHSWGLVKRQLAMFLFCFQDCTAKVNLVNHLVSISSYPSIREIVDRYGHYIKVSR